MNNKPADPRFSPIAKREKKVKLSELKDSLRFGGIKEKDAWWMIIVFFTSAFLIYMYFNKTLITVLETSKLFVLIGLAGFLLAYLLRKPLRLSILDGLFYNVFGIAPAGLATILVLNAQCDRHYIETYQITDRESGGSGFTCILEGNALEEFWHIRNLEKHEVNLRGTELTLKMCDGTLGYPVVILREVL